MSHSTVFASDTESVSFGPWKLQIHQQALQLEEFEKRELSALALRWAAIFPIDPLTLAQAAFGVPSVLIRFDYVVSEGRVCVYEIEDRPAFVSIGSLLNPEMHAKTQRCIDRFRQHLNRPIFTFVSPSRFANSDDILHGEFDQRIFDGVTGDLASIPKDAALIVRSERSEAEYWHLESRSLSTVSQEGWKGYGISLGLWKRINEGPLDFANAFVLKPEFGCRSEGVYLYHPDRKSKGKYGFSTRTAVQNAVDEGRARYIQPYAEPEHHEFLGRENCLIRRVYFGFDPTCGQYECLGGVYMARPCVKVHGATDTITGNIIL